MKLISSVVLISLSLLHSSAQGRVTKIESTSVQNKTFSGRIFATGEYTRITGRYSGELDPNDPRLSKLVDIHLAEKNSRGKIAYTADYYILQPSDLNKSNRTLFYDFANRGNKSIVHAYGSSSVVTNSPGDTALDAGDGFLMDQGFILVWSGFLGDVQWGNNRLTIDLPIAKNPDGSRIEGTIMSECFNDYWTNSPDLRTCALAYAVPRMDKSVLKLYVRERREDPPVEITDWQFVNDRTIRLANNKMFKAGLIYQVIHQAVDPIMMAIGYAAVADWISFLKNQTADDFGTPNPVAGFARHAVSYGLSQTGRVSRDFLYQGFNEDEAVTGGKIFEGMTILGAATRPFINFRFGQPTRGVDLAHEGMYYPTPEFPFAFQDETDPLTGKVDGILNRCTKTKTCPKIFYAGGNVDYWVLRNSLLTTDPTGTRDSVLPDSVRIHLFAGLGHSIVPTGYKGSCQNPGLDGNPAPFLHKFAMDLQQWIAGKAEPPPSQYPRIDNGTLVEPLKYKWSGIPGQPHPASLATPNRLFDYGAEFANGIWSNMFPDEIPSPYKVLVPQVGDDGNELAGLKLPIIRVPVATYTGWNRRERNHAVGVSCGVMGSEIRFAQDASVRSASGDSRISIAELYPSITDFHSKIDAASDDLILKNYILSSDRKAVVDEARQKWFR